MTTRIEAIRMIVSIYEVSETECWLPEQVESLRKQLSDVLDGLEVTQEELNEL